MKIINKLEKHNIIVESINDDIDILLNENIFSDLVTLVTSGPIGLIRKKIIKTAIKKGIDELTDTEKEKEELEKSEDPDQEELKKIDQKIKDLNDKLDLLFSVEKESLPFKKVIINFKNKTSVDIEKLKSPEYKRNLLGTMYFTVVKYDEKNNIIELKTTSFPDTLRLRLTYDKLIDNQDQKGTIQLIYNKYGKSTSEDISGDEKDIYFNFLKIS
jgi:hypothetical protein